MHSYIMCSFFFFQAEDGIRDYKVTGVQTCALPIFIRRRSVSQPVQTGIMAIDAMIPIGRGQRELIIGDRATGKTTICLDTMISQAQLNKAAEAASDHSYRPLYCIYVAIGQKQSTIARVIATLEQAARVGEKYGNGSLTALPIIETQAGDVSAYIPTNVISITDGQIYLETDLFHQGVRPAISIGLSVSRVGSAAQPKAMKQVAGQLKGDLAQFRELAAFAQFGADLDAKTQAQIDRGKRVMEIFKQPPYNPIPVDVQVAIIWAVQSGYVDRVPVERVKAFQSSFTDFLSTRHVEVLTTLKQEAALSDALKADLKTVADVFTQTWK